MENRFKSGQRGISFFGLIFVMVVLAVIGVVGAQVFPTVLEFNAVQKAANKAAREGGTVIEVRNSFDKAADIDNITSISGKDLNITKNGDQVVVAFAYNKEIHLAGPAYLLMKYAGTSRLQTR